MRYDGVWLVIEEACRALENRIDLSVLQDLTDHDLRDLGVVLLRALRDLGNASSPQRHPRRRPPTEPNHFANLSFWCPKYVLSP
jgi:hypothetical protein